MNSESNSKIADVIHDLEEVLKSTTELAQIQRLQRAINTLKNHSITVQLNDNTITFLTERIDDVKIGSEEGFKPITAYGIKPEFSRISEERTDKDGVRYVDTKIVADYYGVSTETVRNWIKDGKISGKQFSNRGKWFIPVEEFEYFKKQKENDDTEDVIYKLLGEDFGDDWEIE